MNLLLSAIGYPNIDPVIVRLGPLAVRWYGLAYVISLLLGYFGLRLMARSGRLRLSEDRIRDLLGWLAAGILLGGRVGWWLFYRDREAVAEPWYEPFALWHGGMSFHGGLAGVALAVFVWSRRARAPMLNIADCLALVAPLGLFFGRVANFVNAELVGRPTVLPWGVIFPGESFPRHPSQLYEAILEGPLMLLGLWVAQRRPSLKDGHTAALFAIIYGTFRFAVEFTRQPDNELGFIALGWLTMGQLLSVMTIVVGIGTWIMCTRRSRRTNPQCRPVEPAAVPLGPYTGQEQSHSL